MPLPRNTCNCCEQHFKNYKRNQLIERLKIIFKDFDMDEMFFNNFLKMLEQNNLEIVEKF